MLASMSEQAQLRPARWLLRQLRIPVNGQSLSRRLITIFAATLITALLIAGAGMSFFTYRAEVASWQGRQGEAADNAASTVGSLIDRVNDTLVMVALLDSHHLQEQPELLLKYLQRNPALLEVLRVDAKGHIIATASEDAPVLAHLFTISQSNWFLQARAGYTYFSSVQFSVDHEPYILMAVPASNGGAVVARLEMSVLRQVVSNVRFGKSGRAYIIDREGGIIVHTDQSVSRVGATLAGRPEMAAIMAAPGLRWSGSYRNLQDTLSVGSTAPVGSTNWVVITELSQNEAFATTRTALVIFGIGMALIVGAVTYVAVGLLRRLILQPIGQLCAGAERFGRGDLGSRIEMARQDELGQVAQEFNEMAGRIQDHTKALTVQAEALAAEVSVRQEAQDELRKLNTQLEDRVSERTEELVKEVVERRRTEETLKLYAAKLERSNRELQDFAYVASHDLQEPLRKVQAFGDRLRDKYGEALGPQGIDYLSRMQGAASRMQTLIEGLLVYSRVTSKAQPFVSVDLYQTAQEVLADLETGIERVQGRVELSELPTIDADPLQVRQLLQNLIGNALKFHKDEEPPIVRVWATQSNGHEPEAGEPPAGTCQLFVQDNGIGFDEKYLDRIFQVFQRLHGRGSYEGAGIGLAVCRRIVERHDGDITAKSAPGAGTTFIVTLPTHQPEGEQGV